MFAIGVAAAVAVANLGESLCAERVSKQKSLSKSKGLVYGRFGKLVLKANLQAWRICW